MRASGRVASTAVLAALLSAGCKENGGPTGPSPRDVAGTYMATTFTLTAETLVEDVLARGGSLAMHFDESGALAGRVVIPSESVNDAFSGRWKRQGNEVVVEDVPTALIQDIAFTIVGGTLVADRELARGRLRVVMARIS